ncbi:hypothetical protein [Archangium violaceum]|uniref:Glycosyltransferase RgtA/B/C/D-like domain-containing protein n=1 Tax=Archangium violaceum Cb vi76 TaxID=1406225 RepID=A0A084SWE7_9BACT|nr:hypothetical protein [Archangium violaceum]KFA92782.1 hypothetical protein Q664_13050 [Archangium violaceum Cb vi76]
MSREPQASPAPPRESWKIVLLLVAWGSFAAWCVSGIPPAVDLPAHAAQMQTLAELLRGNPQVSTYYEAHFPLGYGLPIWLFLPVTLLTNGAFAARLAAWTALMLFPLAHLAFTRVLHRPAWTVVFGLPLAFNISYWYGFLPSLFSLPLALLSLALYLHALRGSGRTVGAVVGLALLSTATMLSHLVAFGALGVGVAALALTSDDRRRAIGLAAAGLALPLALCATRVLTLASRAVTPGNHMATDYGWGSHFNWLLRNYRPEGRLAVIGPVLVTLVFVAAYLRHRREEPRAPWVLFLALGALFLVTPKALSGAWLIHVRLPVLAGIVALVLVDPVRIERRLRILLLLVVVASLAETARYHWRFKLEVAGLETLVASPPPPGVHGYVSLVGNRAQGSRLVYLEHLGQWWTATQGGVGHHFFADADHQPVRFRPGQSLPQWMDAGSAEQLAPFRALLVYGDAPLPGTLEGFEETGRAGSWLRLERR